MKFVLLAIFTLTTVPLHGMEIIKNNGVQKPLREKIIALVEQQQQLKKQFVSDFQLYQLLSAAQYDNPFYVPKDLISLIICAAESNALQSIFDECEARGDRSDYKNSPYNYLIEYLKTRSFLELEKLFNSLPKNQESMLKIALRMIYSKHNRNRYKDLDDIEYGCFFRNCMRGMNYMGTGNRIEIYKSRFGEQLKDHLKDFFALLQPMLDDHLYCLVINDNDIFMLPETFGWFKDLEYIRVTGNKLERLPECIAQCQKLVLINLSDNCLTEVPEVLRQCKQLENLELDGNPIQELPLWLTEFNHNKLNIKIDKDVAVPWSKQDYPDIRICKVTRVVRGNGIYYDYQWS